MNVMEEIFEIRSCTEMLANDVKIYTIDESYGLISLQDTSRRALSCPTSRRTWPK